MPNFCKPLIVILCLLLPLITFGQEIAGNSKSPYFISGIVKDNKGGTLPGVIVFLGNSKKITSTDANGVFKLDGLSAGTYQVITKMISYASSNKNITITGQSVNTEIILDESNTQLKEVVITAGPRHKSYLRTFLRYFIGESANSSACKLLNPEALNFHYQRKNSILTATSDDFLIIENKGLGYRLKYLLSGFEFNYNTNVLHYSGAPYFEELPGTERERKQWAKNRAEAYAGSVMHFFRSVVNNNLAHEGFVIYNTAEKDGADVADYRQSLDSLWTIHPVSGDMKYIKPKNKIIVAYTRGFDATFGKNTQGQVSEIKPQADTAIVDKNGDFTNTSFLFLGYWASKAIAEMLPLDYGMGVAGEPKQQLPDSRAQRIVTAVDSFNRRVPSEKVFVHIDKPYYTTTDTIWMKSCILDAGLNYSKQSGLLYVELVNDTGKVVIRQSMPVRLGISFGQMILDDKTVADGSYTLRAYTNQMQNQGEESFFTRQLYINKTTGDPWLVNTGSKLTKKQGADNLELALLFTNSSKFPVRLREMQLKVMQGNKVLSRDNLQTDINGSINVNFNLPQKGDNKRLIVIAQDLRKGEGDKKLIIPITINRPENTDLQFMPEGGGLVAGLPSRIGFKALDEDGLGTAIKGNIVNTSGTVVASFSSVHNGMGSFELAPVAGETYSAQVTLPGGSIKTYPLPVVKSSGIVIHVANPVDRDSLYVTLYATDDVLKGSGAYSLIAQSGGKVCYAANISFADGVVHGRVDKARFSSGITRFTLFNADKLPMADRLVFIDNHDGLHISINTDKPVYQPKDSVALHIQVTDKDNIPVTGSFSMAITDDSSVKTDSTNVPDIQSYMLLTGDLKGNIEEPGYYFDSKHASRYDDIDNLLLTQGWVGYDWAAIFNPQYKPAFRAGPGIEVSGYLSRTGGKSLSGLPVMLLSTKKPMLVRDTLSDKDGRFVFRNLPLIDTASFMLQVKDKKGKMFEADVHVDEFTPAGVSMLNIAPLKPWYVNSDSTLLNYMKQDRAYSNAMDNIKYPGGIRHLKEVMIKGKKTIKGSHNLNGNGNADQVLDEEDMKKANKMTLEDMLNKGLIKGFGLGWFPRGLIPKLHSAALSDPRSGLVFTYQIYANKMRLVIDGVDVHTFFQPVVYGQPSTYEEQNFYKQYLQELTAEDIKGIEVLYNNRYNNKYSYAYLEPQELDHTGHEFDPWNVEYAYLEITTWSGNGAYMKRTHGKYLYRPLPITWPRQFYKPKYTAKNNTILDDLRPTVLWEPNIVTDTAGKATIWFYAKGKAANYTGIIQGSDLGGSVGQQKIKIIVKN